MKKIFYIVSLLILICICNSCEKYDPYDFTNRAPISQICDSGISVRAYMGSPNSVGGCKTFYEVINQSSKSIKYIHINVLVLNKFNDRVYCEIWDKSNVFVTLTGPLHSGYECTWETTDLFYNWNAKNLHLDYIRVEFTDGTDKELYID